jgi:hypothetical protein
MTSSTWGTVGRLLDANLSEKKVRGADPKEVAPKLQPLTLSSEWAKFTTAWTKQVPAEDGRVENGDLTPFVQPDVVLTSKPELLDRDTSGFALTAVHPS